MTLIMTRSVLVALLIALAFMGVADSWYLAEHAATDTDLFCDIGAGLDGCNIVAQSPYSQFYGIPLAYFGVAFYAILFLAAALLTVFPYRLYYRGVVALTGIGAAASVVFVGIQLLLIKAVCIYCFVSAGIAFLSFLLAILLLKRFAPNLPAVVP